MATVATTCIECGARGSVEGPEGMEHKTILCNDCKPKAPTEPEIILDAATCAHEQFIAQVQVDRIMDGWNGRPNVVLGFYANIMITCNECKTPFHFKGLPYGMTPTEPRIAVGGLEARMPIGPGELPIAAFGEARYEPTGPAK